MSLICAPYLVCVSSLCSPISCVSQVCAPLSRVYLKSVLPYLLCISSLCSPISRVSYDMTSSVKTKKINFVLKMKQTSLFNEIPDDCLCSVVLFFDLPNDYMSLRHMNRMTMICFSCPVNFYCTKHLIFRCNGKIKSPLDFILNISSYTEDISAIEIYKLFPNAEILQIYCHPACSAKYELRALPEMLRSLEIPGELFKNGITKNLMHLESFSLLNGKEGMKEEMMNNLYMKKLKTLRLPMFGDMVLDSDLLGKLPQHMDEISGKHSSDLSMKSYPTVKTLDLQYDEFQPVFFSLPPGHYSYLQTLRAPIPEYVCLKTVLCLLPRDMKSISLYVNDPTMIVTNACSYLPMVDSLEFVLRQEIDILELRTFRLKPIMKKLSIMYSYGIIDYSSIKIKVNDLSLYAQVIRFAVLPDGLRELDLRANASDGDLPTLPQKLTRFRFGFRDYWYTEWILRHCHEVSLCTNTHSNKDKVLEMVKNLTVVREIELNSFHMFGHEPDVMIDGCNPEFFKHRFPECIAFSKEQKHYGKYIRLIRGEFEYPKLDAFKKIPQ